MREMQHHSTERTNSISTLSLKLFLEVLLLENTPHSAAATSGGTAGDAHPSSPYGTTTPRLLREV